MSTGMWQLQAKKTYPKSCKRFKKHLLADFRKKPSSSNNRKSEENQILPSSPHICLPNLLCICYNKQLKHDLKIHLLLILDSSGFFFVFVCLLFFLFLFVFSLFCLFVCFGFGLLVFRLSLQILRGKSLVLKKTHNFFPFHSASFGAESDHITLFVLTCLEDKTDVRNKQIIKYKSPPSPFEALCHAKASYVFSLKISKRKKMKKKGKRRKQTCVVHIS